MTIAQLREAREIRVTIVSRDATSKEFIVQRDDGTNLLRSDDDAIYFHQHYGHEAAELCMIFRIADANGH